MNIELWTFFIKKKQFVDPQDMAHIFTKVSLMGFIFGPLDK